VKINSGANLLFINVVLLYFVFPISFYFLVLMITVLKDDVSDTTKSIKALVFATKNVL